MRIESNSKAHVRWKKRQKKNIHTAVDSVRWGKGAIGDEQHYLRVLSGSHNAHECIVKFHLMKYACTRDHRYTCRPHTHTRTRRIADYYELLASNEPNGKRVIVFGYCYCKFPFRMFGINSIKYNLFLFNECIAMNGGKSQCDAVFSFCSYEYL